MYGFALITCNYSLLKHKFILNFSLLSSSYTLIKSWSIKYFFYFKKVLLLHEYEKGIVNLFSIGLLVKMLVRYNVKHPLN